ncbi:MAG: UbiA prenyltransferase family protein [Armatimonadetes bacterium]|nr:UbiA prenyltransferase family protein [Armatimonadota bacterium]
MLKNLVLMLRPKQWAKNLLVFAAWMFAGKYTDLQLGYLALAAFTAMVLVSSGVYIGNDIFDVERDRRHPKRKNRPIASGAIPIPVAATVSALLIVAGLGVAFLLNKTSFSLVAFYLLLQVAYNLKLKAVPVLDVFVIATGFVLRAVLGATAIFVNISGWFLFCTGALALMLGFAKRRNEFILQGNGGESRESLAHYSKPALDALVTVFGCGAAMCYGIYTLESSTAKLHPSLIITAPFVFYGITRYLLLVFQQDEGGEPADLLFGDWHIVGSVVLFVVAAGLAMSGLTLRFLEP